MTYYLRTALRALFFRHANPLAILCIYILVFILSPCRAADRRADRIELNDRISLVQSRTFPKIAVISFAGNYDDPVQQRELAKADLLILGAATAPVSAVRALKALNNRQLIGLYTVLNEARKVSHVPLTKERTAKLDFQGWWLKNARGEPQRWTSKFDTWDINVTDWAKPDADGLRYPEWVAGLWFRHLFSLVPEADIWFFDNLFVHQRIQSADWVGTGVDQSGSDPSIQRAFRVGQRKEIEAARQLAPNLLFVANADNDLSSSEYQYALNGGLLECMVGQRWSLETRTGWQMMMQTYKRVVENLRSPALTIFGLCMKDETNYSELRYSLASALMGGGYFQVSDQSSTYRKNIWFDEFRVDLGQPIDPAFPSSLKNGAYARRFENGIVVLNPTARILKIDVGKFYRHFHGTQDPIVNSGKAVEGEFALPARDAVILIRR